MDAQLNEECATMNIKLNHRPAQLAGAAVYANAGDINRANRAPANPMFAARRKAAKLMRRCRGYLLPSAPRIGGIQLATGAALITVPFSGASWHWYLLALFGYFMHGCVGHSIGYHRYFAHRSFKAPKWAEVLFTLCGVLGCVGPPLAWSFMHRRHHAKSDRNGDPYTAHLYPRPHWRALLLGDYRPGYSEKRLRRVLRNQPLQRIVHQYYFGIVGIYALTLLAIDWRLFLFGWVAPVALTLWISALDAYTTHHWGYRNHQTRDASRNLWWMALLFWGEGWHNNHHARPGDWNFRQRWWEFDIGAMVITALGLRPSSADKSDGEN